MSVPTVSWDETSPPGNQAISLGDNRIREAKTQIREIIDVDHDFPSSGSAADNGQHKQVTLQEQADLGTGAVGATILGSQTVSGKGELVYTDEDDNDIQITSGGLLMAGQLANDTYLLATNNAGTGTVNLIKANTSDTITFGVVATLVDGSLLATSGAPTSDAMIANKKYVDDQIGAVTLSETGDYCWSARASKTGWLICDGSAVSRTTYSDLFSEIGTTYGVGDGSTTFNVPNIEDRYLFGAGNLASLGSKNTDHLTLSGTGDAIQMLTGSNGKQDGGGTCTGKNRNVMMPYLGANLFIKT